jgi:iron(III) transport system ATP-binding protein
VSEAAAPRPSWRRWGPRGTAGAAIPARLAFENVSHGYGAVAVLHDVSLAVEAGEMVCLLGASGCGKTTLLRLAAGVERPRAGRILLDDREMAAPGRFVEPEDRGVGLMFQDYALFPHMSVLDNVLFGLRSLALSDARTAALRALSRVGMEGFAQAYPDMLSGGEQQRVALARAVAPRPGVVLMDEPFSNLDRRMRDAVREETVALLREMGATTVIVTHDPEEAMRIADRVILMREGRIVQAGPAEALYHRPVDLATARFFCDFTEVEGRVRGGRIETPLGLFPAPHVAEGAGAVACVRPQAVRLRAAGFCIPGRVLNRRFLGELDLLELAVQGLDVPLKARLRGHKGALEGEDVGVEIDPDEVLVFAAPGP